MSVRGARFSCRRETALAGTPRSRLRLTDDERLRIHLWIDLNVPF